MKGNDINGDTFVFFPTFVPQLRAIKNKEVELRMRYAIEDYGIDGILPDFSDIDPLGLMDGMFEQFKFLIDSAKAKRKKQSETNSNNGKNGGAQPGNQNARKRPKTSENKQNKRKRPKTSETSLNVNVNGNVESIESDNIRARENNAFEKFLKEVFVFADDQGINEDECSRFVEYTSNNFSIYADEKGIGNLYDKNGEIINNWKGALIEFARTQYNRAEWEKEHGIGKYQNQ